MYCALETVGRHRPESESAAVGQGREALGLRPVCAFVCVFVCVSVCWWLLRSATSELLYIRKEAERIVC